jgi:hypothetical protein
MMIPWQQLILTWLDLKSYEPVMVTDDTGLLQEPEFYSYLETKGIPVRIAATDQDILKVTNEQKTGLIVLPRGKQAPYFLCQKLSCKTYSHTDLPLNGDKHLLKGASAQEIAALLDFLFQTDPHLPLTNHNIEDLRKQSRAYAQSQAYSELNNHLEKILDTAPNFQKILKVGRLWGEMQFLSYRYDISLPVLTAHLDAFAERFVFSGGMKEAFFASTTGNPRTVDRILGHISAAKPEKFALICLDCMGMAEWALLRQILESDGMLFEQQTLFALLPTVTAISRMAIFSGSREVYQVKSPGRSAEAKAFTEYFSGRSTRYFTESDTIDDEALLGYDAITVLYTFFDDLAHAAQFPVRITSKNLYFNAVSIHVKNGRFVEDLRTLLQNGFSVYLCSDHGSTVATGNGRRLEKYVQEKFAKRGCLVSSENKELTSYRSFPVPFEPNKVIVIPDGRQMFAFEGTVEINHGGISVDEMVVPLVKIKHS